MSTRILIGDCREVLKSLPDESVHCCVSSPPYWRLRSYLPSEHPNKHLEIGSEPTLQEWVDTMVSVFREVRRVLRPDGTLWLNFGESYAGSRRGGDSGKSTLHTPGSDKSRMTASRRRDNEPIPRSDMAVTGLKPKDMMGQPWRVAFALQADGWHLRQDIIWSKPNPMPESVRDRCTKAHEYVFLLSKSERYFYDFEAMQEPVTGGARPRRAGNVNPPKGQAAFEAGDTQHRTKSGLLAYAQRQAARVGTGVGFGHGFDEKPKPRVRSAAENGGHADGKSDRLGRGPGWRKAKAEAGAEVGYDEGKALRMAVLGEGELTEMRNRRSVWTIATEPFKGAHYATFPSALVEPCLLAGCPEGGTVLDPFGGSGTVAMVADRQHKHAILIDLDERNHAMATERVVGDSPLFAEVSS